MEVQGRGRDGVRGREDLEDGQASVLCSWREVVEAEVKALRLSAVDLFLRKLNVFRESDYHLISPFHSLSTAMPLARVGGLLHIPLQTITYRVELPQLLHWNLHSCLQEHQSEESVGTLAKRPKIKRGWSQMQTPICVFQILCILSAYGSA
jgi:hypothetical protein